MLQLSHLRLKHMMRLRKALPNSLMFFQETQLADFLLSEVLEPPVGFPNSVTGSKTMNEFYHKFQPKEWNKVKYFGGIRKALVLFV